MPKIKEPFFFYHTLVLIAVVICGFSIAAFQRPGGPLNIPLFLHLHGAVFLGWFALIAVQSRLIGSGNYTLHKRLGYFSVLHAAAIVIIGYLVIDGALDTPGFRIAGRPAVMGSVFPLTDIVNFVVTYTLAYQLRYNAAAHKRFMLMTAILMIDPAVARLVFGLGLPGMLIVALEVSLIAAVLVYDIRAMKRPHWATLIGLVLYGAAMAFKLNINSMTWWPEFIDILFGPVAPTLIS